MLFENNKGSLTKTGIVLAITSFYLFIGIGLGFYGEHFNDASYSEQEGISVDNETDQAGGFFSKLANIKIFGFLGNIIIGIGALPPVLNTMIFAPLGIAVLWIIISSLPTFNGGG